MASASRSVQLALRFDDGVERVIHLEPVAAGALYKPLRDPALLRQVKIDTEVHTLVESNGPTSIP